MESSFGVVPEGLLAARCEARDSFGRIIGALIYAVEGILSALCVPGDDCGDCCDVTMIV